MKLFDCIIGGVRRMAAFCGVACAVAAFSGCADAEYSGYACRLVINNLNVNNMTLASAMTAASPGVFCRISKQGTTRFMFESNQGGVPTYALLNAIDQNSNWVIGIYNGIIVGFGNLDGTFHAYDNQCPNCYPSTGLPRYALSLGVDGKATCKSCKRVYDMNNNGLLVSGDQGKGLIKYRAATTGPFGVLSVYN